MQPENASSPTERGMRAACLHTSLVAAAVAASFLAYSALQTPVPASNEPQYLGKAKFYWDPEYCRGDFFLGSAHAHLVFYQAIGWLTRFLSLEQTAWSSRFFGYALLAYGWTRLAEKLTANALAPLWSAWVFLAVVTVGNLSGEWIVGGIEAKIFSYGLLFWALAAVAEKRWIAAGILGGLAISLHPVVGGWGLIAAGLAAAVTMLRNRPVPPPALWRLEPLQRCALPVLLLAALSLPGVVPALSLLFAGENVNAAQANRIQIFDRLAHHLDPNRFATTDWGNYQLQAAWLGYVFLTVFWLAVHIRTRRRPFDDFFARFVLITAVIAGVGYFAGQMPRLADGLPDPDAPLLQLRVMLLKLYPFRMFDVLVPIATATAVTNLVDQHGKAVLMPGRMSRIPSGLFNTAIFVGFLAFALLQPIPDRNPSHMPPEEHEQWIATCRWIDENLPRDVQVLTPSTEWTDRNGWAFKWYAQRPEYFSYKDCPQDAAGILEWNRRRAFLRQWSAQHADERPTWREWQELSHTEHITHIVVPEPESAVGFRVYDIRHQRLLR